MHLGLENKIAIVTGGAAGIGKGIVECLAREGTTVVIADKDVQKAQEVASQIGKGAIGIKTDVANRKDVEDVVKKTLDEFSRIDILVNNAGISQLKKFVDMEEAEWDRMFNINVKAVYLMTRAVLPHMIKRKYGKIVNISSFVAKEAIADFSHYCATKFAIAGLTQSLAKEYAQDGINVNAVCPGVVRTSLWDSNLELMHQQQGISHDEAFANFCQIIPLRRPQTPQDIGNMVAFLVSDIAKNITGEGFNVTGGIEMRA